MLNEKKLSILKKLSFFFLGTAIILIICNTRLLSDDLFYYTFFKHGFSNFINLMKTHYETINGRLFVHSVLSFLLSFSSLLPALISVFIFIICTIFLGTKLLQNDSKKLNITIFLLIGFSILLIGDNILIDSIFWLSGFFNYMFPLMLLCAYIVFFKKANNTKYAILAIIFSFLSTITTELNGAITIIFSIIFLIYHIIKKNKLTIPITCLITSILGVTFLFMSPGIQNRLLYDNDIGFIQRSLIMFSTFSQMTFEISSLSFIFLLSSSSCAICTKKKLNNTPLAIAFGILSVCFLLSVLGITIPTFICMALYLVYILLLLIYSFLLFKKNDIVIALCTVGFISSFGIICASGVISHRGLFLPGIFLIAIFIRSISHSELKEKDGYILALCLGILSMCNAVHFFIKTYPNSKIWDHNKSTLESYVSGDTIYLENYIDESYYKGSFEYFSYYYLPEYGIDKDVTIKLIDKQYYTITDEFKNDITDLCIKRANHYYIPIRVLADYLNAQVIWRYDTASIIYNNKLYKFKSLINAVMTSDIGGFSFKSKVPFRIIDQTLYISIDDANSIFGTSFKAQ